MVIINCDLLDQFPGQTFVIVRHLASLFIQKDLQLFHALLYPGPVCVLQLEPQFGLMKVVDLPGQVIDSEMFCTREKTPGEKLAGVLPT